MRRTLALLGILSLALAAGLLTAPAQAQHRPGHKPRPTPTPTMSPTPSPVPTPTPIPPSGAAFVADAETGDTSQWCFVHSAVPVGVVTTPVRAGSYSFKTEVRDGALIYDTERSQYANGPGTCDKHKFYPADETWTAVSVYFPTSFPSFAHWSLIVQWHESYGGTPPQQVSVNNDVLSIYGVGSISPRPRYIFGTVQRGVWTDLLVHQKWSSDPAIGFVEVYVNGALALPLTYLKTLENSNPVDLEIGQYRDTSPTTGTAVAFFDEVRVGPTRATVEPP